ncbi:carbamoyl phosphate synthase small subunit [Kroppenstedtia eburnea]|uniref:Carbamoyl phosphate synthase small chain n=1 Tax=Kroppenstedtia eburnea TaxID=714067 RepID=A0A1N7J3U0_9BACL|nr:carbamoyl phosphate synthase small subunit [Kroppenstedtia eburnea]QKI82479.1 glutamine-hydrolyzing carbamoyl-phosphate synthase small subunit [Kroppenstedtia eburnea]SIS44010.1 carbamoyl-phosphate synthase small subunit [Kroppenstedtia eburnea]
MEARLLLEDGTRLEGEAFGAESSKLGEVVFSTGMTGYQEVLTDASGYGQIVTMTYPLIGNSGINRHDLEARQSFIHGLVVREHATSPNHRQSEGSLDRWLKECGIPGIAGVDTRMLTRKIRAVGTMKGILSTTGAPWDALAEKLEAGSLLRDQVARVSTGTIHSSPGSGPRVVLMDFGAKYGIQRELIRRGCDVVVVPWDTPAEEMDRLGPDGILLSNGPGNPKDIPEAIATVGCLLHRHPLFGIGLGHQLFALAAGADTEKMKFGHRGSNHPVKDLTTGRTWITSQNHGYTVRIDSLAQTDLTVTHIALNDGTCEGLAHPHLPAFSVQYHPEAAPGPHDSGELFDRFLASLHRNQEGTAHA